MDPFPSVSVLLVTKNGERYLAEVLEHVGAQHGHFRLCEIIAVDSGSRDDTLSILRRFGVKLIQIPPREFGHGKTRNLAAAQAEGDYLVFLTQDATPANDLWLDSLLAPLHADQEVVGAYSRHLPRPHCHPMEWRRIAELELAGQVQSRINSARGNPEYANHPAFFYFLSNVSSVLRRGVWQQFPFPEVEFGEDQLWAKQVLEAGYKTAYCADSLIYHSHSYGPWDNFGRHFDHAWALLRDSSGQQRQVLLRDCLAKALRTARADLAFWYHQNGQRKAHVVRRWALPAFSWHLAGNLGLWLGERVEILPGKVRRSLSFQERVKRR